jgi:hypothetical protein
MVASCSAETIPATCLSPCKCMQPSCHPHPCRSY